MKGAKANLVTVLLVVIAVFALAGCGGDTAAGPTATTGLSPTATKATEAATSTPAGSAWQKYTSTEGRFRASFPGKPVESKQIAKSEIGELTNYFFKHQNGSTQYMVSYVDYPADAISGSDPKVMVADGFSKTFESSPDTNKVVSKSEITVNGYPGMEAEIDYTSGNYVWYRQMLVENRMYQLLATTTTDNKDKLAADAKKFHEAFEIIGSAPGGNRSTPTMGGGTSPGTSGAAPANWQAFTSSEGKFSVSMPGTPEKTNSTSETAVGSITQYLFQYSKDGSEFAVAYADYPEQTSEADAVKLLEDTIKGAAQGSKIENQQASTLQGNASVTGEWKAGEFNYTWYKAVLVGDRLYQVITATTTANKDSFATDAKAFIQSFQLNP